MEEMKRLLNDVDLVEVGNIMMVINDEKKDIQCGLIDMDEWDTYERHSTMDILTTVLNTYFPDEFPRESTIDEIAKKIVDIFVVKEYDSSDLDVMKCESLCGGEIRYSIKLPDNSTIKIIEHMDTIYMTCGYHLWYVLSLLRNSSDLNGWIECCKNIKYRYIGYYDLIQIEGVGHVPVPIALEKLGYEDILKIPISNRVRDDRFYRCGNCGRESFYHLHPCEMCGEGYEKYSSDEKEEMLMNKNLIYEYICAQ